MTGAELLLTFLSHRIQLFRQGELTMWMYPGPSSHDRPFSTELGDTEINTQIRVVLAHGADVNLSSGPPPLREGVDNPWVSLLGLIFGYCWRS
jgi:hypothetical protein